MNTSMGQPTHEIVVKARGVSKVRELCEALADIMALQCRLPNTAVRHHTNTISLASGLTLKFGLLHLYVVEQADPVQIDTLGRIVNADITIRYLEAES